MSTKMNPKKRTSTPIMGSPERIAEAIRTQKSALRDIVPSRSPSIGENANKKKRLTPVQITEPVATMTEPTSNPGAPRRLLM